MCGFVGFINCGNPRSLKRATEVIAHRGPDDEGIEWFRDNNCGLGHRRLSIIDLSRKGHQPMFDEVTKNWIIYNGEIYNYLSIKKKLVKKGYTFYSDSDTEVLLKAYAEWGKNCLELLNGMFSFAIYNVESNLTFIARDRLGIKPLYYHHKDNKLIFASEIKSILLSGEYNKEPDLYALHTTVHFQVSPYTGFKNIYKLPAGSYLEFKNGEAIIEKYWSIKPQEKIIPEIDAIDQLDQLINNSITLQMIADVPIGTMLSGGLDSSLISVLMQQNINNPVNSFTIKFNDDDLIAQGNVDDSFYAKKVANTFGFNHNEIVIDPDIVNLLPKLIWHLDEPISDPSVINTYLISKMAQDQGIKVLLSGMGADEVFAGYRSYLACQKADSYQKLPIFLMNVINKGSKLLPDNIGKFNLKYVRWVKQFLKFADLSQFDRHINIKNSAFNEHMFQKIYSGDFYYHDSPAYKKENELFHEYNNISYLTKMNYCDTNIYMCDHNLAYTDKSSMAKGIEVRPPLLDHRIVEFMFSLPNSLKIKGNIQKYLLKKVSEKYLPTKIINRSKAPFSAPMRRWLRKDLKEMVQDLLSEESLKKRGVYEPQYVHNLIVENEQGRVDNSQIIWRLITNELWYRTFFN